MEAPNARQFRGADECQDEPDEEVDQRHDAQRLRSAFLHYQEGVGPAELSPPTQQVQEGQDVFAREGQQPARAGPGANRRFADPLEKGGLGCGAGGVLLLGHDLRKLDQLRHLCRQSIGAEFEPVGLAEGVAFEDECHEPAVPAPEGGGIELERLGPAGRREFMLHGADSGQSCASQPVASDFEQQRAARAQPDSQPGLGLLVGHK